MTRMGLERYDPAEWKLFLDSSKASLKAVLLHNGNQHGSIPVGHSVILCEDYDAVSLALEKLNYEQHLWPICVDLKMVSILLGQQAGYTKYPCFECLWDSRADTEHWKRRSWPKRELLDRRADDEQHTEAAEGRGVFCRRCFQLPRKLSCSQLRKTRRGHAPEFRTPRLSNECKNKLPPQSPRPLSSEPRGCER